MPEPSLDFNSLTSLDYASTRLLDDLAFSLEHFEDLVDRKRLGDLAVVALDVLRLEERIHDGFFGGLDRGHEDRRHVIIGDVDVLELLELLSVVRNAVFLGGRECDREVARTVRGDAAR